MYKLRQDAGLARKVMMQRFANLGIDFEQVLSKFPILVQVPLQNSNSTNICSYAGLGFGVLGWVWRVERDFYLIYLPSCKSEFLVRQGNIELELVKDGDAFRDHLCNICLSIQGVVCKDANNSFYLEASYYTGDYFNNPEWEIVKKTKKVDVTPQKPAGIEDIPAPAKERCAIRKAAQKTAEKKQKMQTAKA